MMENNRFDFDRTENNLPIYNGTPQEEGFSRTSQPQQTASGSYYSPRSGYPAGGGYIPPAPDGGYGGGGSDDEPPKKKHTGLKVFAAAAAVAFVSYASISCYRFATNNDAVRSMLNGDTSDSESSEEDGAESIDTTPSGDETDSESSAAQNSSADSAAAEPVSWIDLAARENAMSIPDIVDKVTPASVGVASTFVYEGQSFSMWGFGQPQSYEKEMSGTGTGIIMSEDGYIITNAHVIYDSSEEYHMGLAHEVQVVLNEDYYDGETQFDATVVGYDVAEDIAVLKINTTQELTVAEFGDSDELRVGELVVAIGNPLGFELFGSVSTGIVSALDREVTVNESRMYLIQTDTAINNGNSGGPLINSYGQVIGINSSKLSSSYSSSSASIEGLCFAIPITRAKAVVNDLINYGYVTGKPMIGITTTDVSEAVSQAYGLPVGVYVRDVEEGGAAALAGIQVGDTIIAINGETVTNSDELNAIKDQFKAGDTVTITVTRGGSDMDFQVILQEKQPADNN